MTSCLSAGKLELLVRGNAARWRAFFWRRHVQRCALCQERLEALREDERFLEEVRRAVSVPERPSPLTYSRTWQRSTGMG